MSDFGRTEIRYRASDSADLSDPYFFFDALFDATRDKFKQLRVTAAISAGTTIELTSYFDAGEPMLALIRNRDVTNYIDVTVQDTQNNDSQIHRVPAGKTLIVQEADPAIDMLIIANTAPVECDVLVVQ